MINLYSLLVQIVYINIKWFRNCEIWIIKDFKMLAADKGKESMIGYKIYLISSYNFFKP